MRKNLGKWMLMGGLGLAVSWPVLANEGLREAWLEATPTHRLAARSYLHDTYPQFRSELLSHLRSRYPNFDLSLMQALVGFGQAHRGELARTAADILKELDGEPLDAAVDVFLAVTERYPNLPERWLELRRQSLPEQRPESLSRLRLGILQQLAARDRPEGGAPVWEAVRAKHPGLGLTLLAEVTERVQSDDSLAQELWTARRRGERPGRYLMTHHPEFVRKLVRELYPRHREELLAVTVDLLQAVAERRAQSPGPGPVVLAELARQPQLAAQLRDQRYARHTRMREALLREFPELPQLVANTLETRHPDLLKRAVLAFETRQPKLAGELKAALEARLPGLTGEVRGFVSSRYPGLKGQLLDILKKG